MILRPLKFYKSLSDGSTRRKEGLFLAEGERFIAQIATVPSFIIEELLIREGEESHEDFLPEISERRYLLPSQFDPLSENRTPQSIMAVVRLPRESYSNQLPQNPGTKILLLEDVQDPGNVGTLLRNAAGFGFDGAILTDKCADPFALRTIAASAGAVSSIWIRRHANWSKMVGELRHAGMPLLVADMAGQPVTATLAEKGCILAMGNEGNGVSKKIVEQADILISVPFRSDRVESLNVAAAGAVCMYLLSQ